MICFQGNIYVCHKFKFCLDHSIVDTGALVLVGNFKKEWLQISLQPFLTSGSPIIEQM